MKRYHAHQERSPFYFTRREWLRGIAAALIGGPPTWLLLVWFWTSQGYPG